MRVVVTGAGGPVASRVARALVSRGHAVTVLERAVLDGREPLGPLLAGYDSVVHVVTPARGAKIDCFRANAEAAAAVARAAPDGCSLVLMSADAASGDDRVTKAIGEACVRAIAARRGLPLTVERFQEVPELKPEFLTGLSKWLFYLKLVVHVVLRYAGQMLSGRLSPGAYAKVLWRSTLLLKAMLHNKVVKLGDTYKMQLYLPAYPTPAFWESVEKFIRPDPGPLTVVFSMTKACGYKCPHCYQRNDSGKDLDIEKLKAVARDMQDVGVTMFDIEGGEPLLKYARLLDLLKAFDGKRELWVNTTGYSLTPERARELKAAGVYGVMISLHTPDPADYEKFTGVPGSFETAREAARMFNEAGITVALNSCPTSELVDRGGVERIMDIAREWGCSFVQIIHGKSAGAWLGKQEEMINAKAKIALLEQLHLRYNSAGGLAAWPAASVQVYEESPEHFGCTAGGIDRFYINANGEVQPCEFLNVSFGNVHEEPFKEIFARMRAAFRKPGVHWLCATEAHSIHETLKANDLKTTPVPWKYTQELIKKWDTGPDTKMYARMDLYE